MEFRTKFSDRENLQRELLGAVEEITYNYGKIEVALSENLYPLDKDTYHFVTRMLNKVSYRDRVGCVLNSILLKEMYKAEVLSGGAGRIAFVFALRFLKELLVSGDILFSNNEARLMKDWEASLEKVKGVIENCSALAKEETLKGVITNICGADENLAEACHQALNLAGLEGKVFIENGKQESYVVELKEGYSFNLHPYKFFLEENLFGSWDHKQCKVLIVDGLVEKVSEIDQILNEAFKTKQPVAIIAHGFSEEVVSTLYLNFKKKLINVIPIRIRPDVSSLNVVNDIGVVCGTIPISALQGQMLAFVKYEDIPTVHRLRVIDRETTIENPKSRRDVSDQIRGLLFKREDYRLQEDIQNIIDQRIRSLIPNTVLVYLPEMSAVQNDAYRVKLDTSLRYCKTMLNYGVVSYEEILGALEEEKGENELEEKLASSIRETLRSFNGKTHDSTMSLYVGILLAGRAALMIYSANGLVEIEI